MSFLYYLCAVFEAKEILLTNNKRKMKKLVLVLAVVFSASLFSCGNSEKAAEATDATPVEEVVEETVVAVDSVVADSAAVDSVAPQA